MSEPLYFSAKSISMSKRLDRKRQTLQVAASHNLRDLQAEHGAKDNIALELSHLNVILRGPASPQEIVTNADQLKAKYAVPKQKMRADHVQALEFVISSRGDTGFDEMAYFNASLRWLIEVFTHEMVLSAVVHYDEGAPHMHVLVLPIIDGEYKGGEPIDFSRLPRLTKRFATDVGKLFGLSFVPKTKFHKAKRTVAFNLIIDHLTHYADPLLSSSVWSVVAKDIQQDPQKYLQSLGLTMPDTQSTKLRTMEQIFTSTGRKTSEDRTAKKGLDLSCVGQRNFQATFSPGARK
jgi:hypothetical protein